MRRALLLLPLLAACGEDVRVVALHGLTPAGPGACEAAEGHNAAPRFDASAGQGYWVAIELQNFGSDPVSFDSIAVELVNDKPWDFLPASNSVPAAITLAAGGDDGDRGLFVVQLIDRQLAVAALLGSEGKQSPIDATGESFPLNFSVSVAGGEELEVTPAEASVTLCNGCLDQDPATVPVEPCATGEPQGCSVAQEDGFRCVP